LGSLADDTVVTEVNFVFTLAVDNTGMLTMSTTPVFVEMLGNTPTLQLMVAVVVEFTVLTTAVEQLVQEVGIEHELVLQESVL
jgi:hypothetical protein